MSDLVLVEHFRFLHLLHGHYLPGLLELAYAHLTKGSSADDAQRIEVFQSDLLSPTSFNHITNLHLPVEFRLLMQYVLFDEFLLSLAQIELLHLLHKHLPSYIRLYLMGTYLPFSLSPRPSTSDTSSRCKLWRSLLAPWQPMSPPAIATAKHCFAEVTLSIQRLLLLPDRLSAKSSRATIE